MTERTEAGVSEPVQEAPATEAQQPQRVARTVIVNGKPQDVSVYREVSVRGFCNCALVQARVHDTRGEWVLTDAEGRTIDQSQPATALPDGELFLSRAAGIVAAAPIQQASKPEALEAASAPATQTTDALVAALRAARPYLVEASERGYDGTNGHGIRQEAKRRIAAIDAAIAKAGAAAPAGAGELTAYRLLGRGDLIERGDEVLADDTVNWLPLVGWEVGMQWGSNLMPMRRRIEAAHGIGSPSAKEGD